MTTVVTIADMAKLNPTPQIAPTMARAHLGEPSDPQMRALHLADIHGRVYRGGKTDQVTVRVLTAAARKGLLRLTAHPGSRRSNWAYGELTDQGRVTLARWRLSQNA